MSAAERQFPNGDHLDLDPLRRLPAAFVEDLNSRGRPSSKKRLMEMVAKFPKHLQPVPSRVENNKAEDVEMNEAAAACNDVEMTEQGVETSAVSDFCV